MKRFYIIGFLILMSFDTLSQISFKYASTQALPLELSPDWLMRLFLNPWLYGPSRLPRRVRDVDDAPALCPGGPSFAASHLELISVTLFSVWLFNEPLNAYKSSAGCSSCSASCAWRKTKRTTRRAKRKPPPVRGRRVGRSL
mgnify:CR=1 FL=1